jgi:putative SOS response-associated peptidase YedK
MCGRYTVSWESATFEKTFNMQAPLFGPSWNIAPTHYAPIVYQPRGARETLDARWGLIPSWVKELSEFKSNLFNARAESVHEKVSFKKPFKSQRCIVPASGFFEWKNLGDSKQPYFIHHEGDELLAFAGLYDHWQRGEKEIYSFTIVTTTPNEVMSELHDRMPVILELDDFDVWLGLGVDTEELEALLQPYDGKLAAHPVSRRVGKPSENDADLIKPIGEKK